MPIAVGDVRARQGNNEVARDAHRQPVSGRAGRMPKRVPGLGFVGNRSWDLRSALTLGTVVLLAGQQAASLGARAGMRRDDTALPPRSPPAGSSLLAAVRPHSVRCVPAAAPTPAAPLPQAFHPDLFNPLVQPLEMLANAEALAVAEESGGAGGSLLWQGIAAWFATPCGQLDSYVNGFWKLQHPPGREIPTRFAEMRHHASESLLPLAQQASTAAGGAEAALAATWAAAADPAGRGWSHFRPQRDAIAALASRADIEHHICQGMLRGQESVLGLQRFFLNGVLAAGFALGSPDGAVYGLPPSHPDVLAYRDRIADLLRTSGMAPTDAAAAADTVLEMERTLAQAPVQVNSYTLSQAEAALPGFAWQTVWQTLGLDPMTSLYITMESCRKLDVMLQRRPLADWRAFLQYHQARRAQGYLLGSVEPPARLKQLDESRGGRLLLSAWYSQRMAPALTAPALAMFDAIRQVFIDDLAMSALPDADRASLHAALEAVQLVFDDAGQQVPWDGFIGSASHLANMQALDALATRNDLSIIEGPSDFRITGPAHHLSLGTNVIDERVILSPALLDSLEHLGSSREERWGLLGFMLGHEIAHLLGEARDLSPEAEALMAREDTAIRQRIGDMWIDQTHLNATRVQEEAACDLRGISAARRAGQAEAEAAGESFDLQRFFLAAAGLHAANPTERQLRRQVAEDDHPPGPFRAGLARFVQGFDSAFGCTPRPAQPFEYLFPVRDAAAGTTDPNRG